MTTKALAAILGQVVINGVTGALVVWLILCYAIRYILFTMGVPHEGA